MMVRELIVQRLRLARPAAGTAPALTGDHMLNPDADLVQAELSRLRAAAVLVPIVERHDGLTVIFTKRAAHLNVHAGQISFPGGRTEPEDPDAVATALRETEEEIGLSANRVEVVGALDEYLTGTGYRVTPIIGFVQPSFTLRPDPFEVADVFEVPFDFLMDPRNHRRERVHWKGAMREYYAMPYNGHHIWGATAGMVRNLYEKMRDR